MDVIGPQKAVFQVTLPTFASQKNAASVGGIFFYTGSISVLIGRQAKAPRSGSAPPTKTE
ncbi:hypothetical protein [Carnimonas nigrificans]|uniref:hypothetical protein n=1 Tax=Carnimonas nigrificans TaxID=64323 RepID=UPI00046EB0F0|nr:hypothetical protein [Carnimonas nigrificans]